MSTQKSVQVEYFAMLREQRGCASETVSTDAATPAELYGELRNRFNLTMPQNNMMVAVNGSYAGWEDPLQADDSVVFIPPVAGG